MFQNNAKSSIAILPRNTTSFNQYDKEPKVQIAPTTTEALVAQDDWV